MSFKAYVLSLLLICWIAFVLFGIPVLVDKYVNSDENKKSRKIIEDTIAATKVEPPTRFVPLEGLRALHCWTFPIDDYLGMTHTCFVCEDVKDSERPASLQLSCIK